MSPGSTCHGKSVILSVAVVSSVAVIWLIVVHLLIKAFVIEVALVVIAIAQTSCRTTVGTRLLNFFVKLLIRFIRLVPVLSFTLYLDGKELQLPILPNSFRVELEALDNLFSLELGPVKPDALRIGVDRFTVLHDFWD